MIISNGELAQIKEWVRKYPNIETGGDLFELWSTGNTAVVRLVFGPGENSRRTSVSYYQDTKYLARVASVLKEKYVCVTSVSGTLITHWAWLNQVMEMRVRFGPTCPTTASSVLLFSLQTWTGK